MASYKWAEVLSADAFGAFSEAAEQIGEQNEAELQRVWGELGQRFRDTVLSMGGACHPYAYHVYMFGWPTLLIFMSTLMICRYKGLV